MRVAFTSYTILNITGTSYSFLPSTGEIWAVDIDGSNLVNLTNGLGGDYPAWQPVPLLLLRRASKSSRGGRSNRCFQQVPVNSRDEVSKG